MFEVVILTVKPELTQNDIDALLPLVFPEKQERIKKFHFKRDALNCLLGDVLACIKICRATNFSSKQLEFSVNTYGKPFLLNSPHIHLMFHILGIMSSVPWLMSLLVDVELIKSVDLKIAKRFFALDETIHSG